MLTYYELDSQNDNSMLADKQLQQLDLNLLKIFEVLYQERNMTTASKVLYVSPSAVSHAVKRLRCALDDDLFVRKGHQLEPTPACKQIAPGVIDLLARLRKTLQQCGRFELAQTQQSFVVAVHDALEPLVLPALHKALSHQAPLASLKSVKLDRDKVTRQLNNRHVDVVIDVARAIQSPIRHQKLNSDNFAILMSRCHPLANQLSQSTYLSAEHITVSNRSDGHVVEDISLLQMGMNRQVKIRCQNYYSAKAIVKEAPLLLTLPSLIANELVDNELIVQPLPIPLPELSTHMYWHQETEQDESIIWLRSAIMQTVS
ncbi:LysR family transcriptional regulator [Alteromonas ponticola]|uniref:LysR family transcriptional regulator n=1 Tax=Alteromonas aquimaris TaxID=2998417 RepID=A0ABT3P6Z5_9ALTE|nr:LysR family transcriptional regulator [Alteromonas aquimaris]MCW8107851.1 LysR family transcriptional regulator [Alteromonas aquimaris]